MADNLEHIPLVSTWKTYLQAYPTRSLLSLKSLWELIYDEKGYLLIDQADTGVINTSVGCSLDHDIICYHQGYYSSNTEQSISYNNTTLSKERAYELLGIDISIASYDPRAKTRLVPLENNSMPPRTFDYQGGQGSSVPIFRNDAVECHDKDSVLKPSDMYDFIRNGVNTGPDPEAINETNSYYGSTSGVYTMPLVSALGSMADGESRSNPIYLNKADISFRGTLTTDIDLDAYNKIILNPKYNAWVPTLVLKALYNQIKYDGNQGGFFNNSTECWRDFLVSWANSAGSSTYLINDLVDFVFKVLPRLIENKDTTGTLSFTMDPDGIWADLLKHTFVWVKAPFFGDYIQPDVFNQDLTSDSNVAHKNIVISTSADFNKYDESTNTTKNLDTDSYPYVPITAPGLDLVSPKLYNSINTEDPISSESLNDISALNSIEAIIAEGDKNEKSKLGSIRFAPSLFKDGTRQEISAPNHLPNYFDPEAHYEDGDFTIVSGSKYHLPTLIPSGGNIYADGRIISPTIDELWVYIKMLTEGRRNDATTVDRLSASEQDMARALGGDTKKINEDTILTVAAKNEYPIKLPDGTPVNGDIIGVDTIYNSESKQYSVKPSRYVNNNDQIKYNIYNALTRISNSVTTFDLSEPNENTNKKDREIFNFTAWSRIYDENAVNNDEVVKDNDTVSVSTDPNIWQPRSAAPYSLRELEAICQGNKFNIITLARFVEENFSVVGPLGYKYYKDENVDGIGTSGDELNHPTQAAGSLYQFHRDYNYKVNNPNTFFRKNGTGASLFNDDNSRNITTSGMDATFNDLTNAAIPETNIQLYNKSELKTSKMPLLVENYGRSVYLDTDFGDYSGADIYMAADGTWRYKAEHSRVPILRSRY